MSKQIIVGLGVFILILLGYIWRWDHVDTYLSGYRQGNEHGLTIGDNTGYQNGKRHAKENMEREAIYYGYGEYYYEDNRGPFFRWKTK